MLNVGTGSLIARLIKRSTYLAVEEIVGRGFPNLLATTYRLERTFLLSIRAI